MRRVHFGGNGLSDLPVMRCCVGTDGNLAVLLDVFESYVGNDAPSTDDPLAGGKNEALADSSRKRDAGLAHCSCLEAHPLALVCKTTFKIVPGS